MYFYQHIDQVDWFLVVEDNNYVIVRNLHRFLHDKSATDVHLYDLWLCM